MILTPFQKLPNNEGNLGKIIVATGFEWLPKVQKIAQSGHTDGDGQLKHQPKSSNQSWPIWEYVNENTLAEGDEHQQQSSQ